MPNATKPSVLFIYKSPTRETTLLGETNESSLRDLIYKRANAYQANLDKIKSNPNFLPYVWEGFLPDDALPFHPQDFATYWPNYGLALPPELRSTQIPRTIQRILAAFPEAKSPPPFTFEGGRAHEGGTIVRGGNLFFYPIHTATDIMTDELSYEEINQRYQETAQTSGYVAIGVDIPRSLKEEPLFRDIYLHIDRMISPPLQLNDGTYIIFAVTPLVNQLKQKAQDNNISAKVIGIPIEFLYIAELLNVPVLSQVDTPSKTDVIFINPLLARILIRALSETERKATATFISHFNLDPILEEIRRIVQLYKNAWQTRLTDQADYIQLDTHLAHIWMKYKSYLDRMTGPLADQELKQLTEAWASNLTPTQRLEVLPYALPTLTRISAGDKCNTSFWPIRPYKT